MEAATIERPETVVSAPTSTIYLSRRAELQLVRIPVRPIYGVGGQKQGDTLGQRVMFHEGRFDCPLEGVHAFDNGETVAADELRGWLDGHRLNGDSAEGFWKVDPTAPAPSPVELQAIVDLAMELDIDSLREVRRVESEGWQRDTVLAMAERAIEKVQELLDAQAVQDANAAKVAAAPTPPVEPEAKPKARGRAAGE